MSAVVLSDVERAALREIAEGGGPVDEAQQIAAESLNARGVLDFHQGASPSYWCTVRGKRYAGRFEISDEGAVVWASFCTAYADGVTCPLLDAWGDNCAACKAAESKEMASFRAEHVHAIRPSADYPDGEASREEVLDRAMARADHARAERPR